MSRFEEFKEIEKKIKDLPKYKIDEKKYVDIKQNIITHAVNYTDRPNKSSMLQRFTIGIASILAILILMGLGFSIYSGSKLPETNKLAEDIEIDKDVAENNLQGDLTKSNEEKQANNSKEWSDITDIQDNSKFDFPTNAKDFISFTKDSFYADPEKDSQLVQSGFDKYYYYYLQALGLINGLDIIKVKGELLEKDFLNLKKLAEIIEEEHVLRGENINYNDYNENKRDANKDWGEPSKRMINAIDYMKQLLNDVDFAINEKESGEVFGFSYQADGKKTDELEKFINKNEH